MSKWKEYKLGDLLLKITKGTTPPKGKGFVDVGINYIKSDAISYDGRINKSLFVCIDEVTHKKFKRSQLEKDDILFSMAGIFLGKNAIVGAEHLPANTNQALAILRLNQEKAQPKFISYFFRQPSSIDYVNNMSGQSAQPNINFQEISSIEINLPTLSEQKAIAEVLSSLDDKIDLLHRQNETLEKMAETLFRKWFVEDADDSWEEKRLENILSVKSSKRIYYKEYVDFGVPFYRSKEIIELSKGATCSSELYITEERFNEIDSQFGSPKMGDILLTSVGTLGISYRVRKNDKFYFKDGNLTWFSDFDDLPSSIIFCWLNSEVGKESLNNITIGSTQAALTISGLRNIKIKIPPVRIIQDSGEKIEPLYNKVESNQYQIRTLEKLRDTLLPKLISGEIRVEGVKK